MSGIRRAEKAKILVRECVGYALHNEPTPQKESFFLREEVSRYK